MRSNRRLAQLWLDALSTELGASAGTIDTYTDDLNCYLAWLEENSLGLDSIGLEQMRDYIAELDRRGYAGSTIARRITVARGLHKFLIAEELGSHDPTSNLSSMRRARKLPFVLSIAETEALLETAHRLAADPSVGIYRQAGYARRAALFETLYASGMRISEALSLPSDAARPGTRMMMVRGKGDKHRLVPLHDRAIAAIADWQKLASQYSGGEPTQWLFHSVRNSTKALTRQAALLEIKEAAVAAGISSPDRVSPHVLRHAFATHMHSGGTDLRVLQELLGHAGIETTQIYTHLDRSRLTQMVRDLHPLNSFESAD
ncbi:tyrosine recombinase [Microvirga tunisiensis]|uniref:Tyrosine recombinase n=1 Tax=Microvirga tunisiensis TaxID=2108360 RepID=A0A5N7MB43_9HYPH|nr:tyrosine recombinase [Microvirga tunisiensis]MPR08154.1 tyrosine recombinase [Microvirga tunisiensis]MPR24133.1 tyrosine recombinase [Microvirga tunisiensis]